MQIHGLPSGTPRAVTSSEGPQMEWPQLHGAEDSKQATRLILQDSSQGQILSEYFFIDVTSLPWNSIALSWHVSPVTDGINSNFLVALPLPAEFPARN